MDEYGARGQRLWDSLLARDSELTDETNPARELAISACRIADRVELLEQQCMTEEPTIINGALNKVVNPTYTEARNQQILLARIFAALRLPDAASGKKPERRETRGVYRTQSTSAMSALDRARNKAAG